MNRTKDGGSDLAYWTLTVVPVLVLCLTVACTIALRLAVGEFKCRHYTRVMWNMVGQRLTTVVPPNP